LAPFRKHLTIISGLRNKPGETPEPHGYIEPTWLTCVKPWDFGVAGPDSGVSADQLAARHIGRDTRLPSLELTTAQVERDGLANADTIAAAGRKSARGVSKAFRPGRYSERTRGYSRRDGEHSGPRKEQAAPAPGQPGVHDRVVVSDYLDSVREIERVCRWLPGRTRAT